jgi:membrane protease YdiL (CAAX protease family)
MELTNTETNMNTNANTNADTKANADTNKSGMKPMWKYTIAAYLAFWAIILVLGGLASMVFDAPPAVMTGITILGSWSPTIVLLLMLGKLKPGLTVKGFYKRAFHDDLSVRLLLAVPVIVFGVLLAAAWVASVVQNTSLAGQIAVPSAFGLAILVTVFQGPSGEESGWRGYLRPELEGRYGFTRGNVILGLVWAFWHAPLWFVASDYAGSEALIYIVANIVVLTALTLIMGVFMRRCNNLFIAFWIHFCFNLSLRLFAGDVYFFVFLSVLYAVVALGLMQSIRPTSPSPVAVSVRSGA